MTLLYDDLLTAYPEARIILVTRPLDRWYTSVASTIFKVYTWRAWSLLTLINPPTRIWLANVNTTWHVFCGSEFFADDGARVKRAGAQYNDRIRHIVPRERLLEWSVQDGWGPLCEFLREQVPDAEFPRVNAEARFLQRSRLEFAYHLSGALAKWGGAGTALSILVLGLLSELVEHGMLHGAAGIALKGFGTVTLGAALAWTCLRWT